jgi:hypothetical protein
MPNILKGFRLKGYRVIGPPPPPPSIGDALGGGYFAGYISTSGDSVATHYLIVSPASSGESASKQQKTSNTSTAGTSSVIDGPTNSANMNDATHPAAEFCEGLSIGGYSDWYLPAKNELEVCYYNLKPTTSNNNVNSGTNTNAVPSRGSNYTTGTPAQTSVTAFQSGGAQAFNSGFFVGYWTSTQHSSGLSTFRQFFGTPPGYQLQHYKVETNRVRAVRRVAV